MLNQKQVRLTVVWRHIWTWLQNSRHLLASFSLPQQNLSREGCWIGYCLELPGCKSRLQHITKKSTYYSREIFVKADSVLWRSEWWALLHPSLFAPLRVGIWANYAILLRDLLFPITLQWHWQGWMAQLEAGDWTYPWQPLGWNITSFKGSFGCLLRKGNQYFITSWFVFKIANCRSLHCCWTKILVVVGGKCPSQMYCPTPMLTKS